MRHARLLLALAAIAPRATAFAQGDSAVWSGNRGFDSTYVIDLTDHITGRIYINNKFNAVFFDDRQQGGRIQYRPNTNVNLGAGVSYRALTLNIGVGLPALNRPDSLRGRSRYLDAQANVFGRRFAANVFAQDFNGYYIDQLGFPREAGDTSYNAALRDEQLRPDLRQRNLGATVLHIRNNRRFSFRAAFNQDAWQRRSAGAWLIGGNLVYQGMLARRSAIPAAIDSFWREPLRIRRIEQVEFGPMGGYAHTFVLKERLYFSLSLCLGIGAVHSVLWVREADGYARATTWSPNLRSQARVAFGFNERRTGFGLSYTNEQSQTPLRRDAIYGWSVGNFRLFYVLRFDRRIRAVDKALHRLRNG